MKILVGMSGGIDSSVAASLLKEQGHEVMGITMTIWNRRTHLERRAGSRSCFAPDKSEDIAQIQKICSVIGIEHTVLELSDRFEELVLDNFKSEYLGGRTPNPCVWCNQLIKFGAMVDYARESGIVFDKFATGHYAQIGAHNGRLCIERAVDRRKDQSYFLYRLSQEQLERTLFPLGSLTKEEVRAIEALLPFHRPDQSESQDFYDGDYTDLFDVEDRVGNIVNLRGEVLGTHNGIFHYTIGQRKGLGVSSSQPLYVIALHPERNEVVVGFREEALQTTVAATDVVWQSCTSVAGEVEAKFRSMSELFEAVAEGEGDHISARFPSSVHGAAPGQSLVLYREDQIVCGGIITAAQ